MIKVGSPDVTEYVTTWGYDAATGRLNEVTGPGLPVGGKAAYEFDSAGRVVGTRFKDDQDSNVASATREFETYRDVVTQVENKWLVNGTAIVSKYAYVNDTLRRRTSVVTTGSAYSPSRFTLWAYNDRDELASSRRYNLVTDITNTASPVANQQFVFGYDPIGNRTAYEGDGIEGALTYTANNLNQYTATSQPAESFQYDGNAGPPRNDGNLTQDGRYDYTYDGENRLSTVTPQVVVTGSKKVEFAYDYRNRRVRKQVWTAATNPIGGGYLWNLTEDRRFIYDGWNLLMELNARNSHIPMTKFTWGMDLSGQNGNAFHPSPSREGAGSAWGGVSESPAGLHGAGGIGGLLAMTDTQGTSNEADDGHLIYFYDANGNVAQVVDVKPSSAYYGQAVARYEYYPFGGILTSLASLTPAIIKNSSGPKNPFMFSTKYRDSETGLYYYGERYLLPRLGRWTNRDPIGERGGWNLYVFVGNSPIVRSDILGLWGRSMHVDATRLIAGVLGEKCADAITTGNWGVDERMGSVFHPQYHFDVDSFGQPFKCGGRSFWQQEWERQAREILAKMCNGSCCEGLGSALTLLGQSLHELQDSYSHCAAHRAESPVDHWPSLCLLPPFWFSPECWEREDNPNWSDHYRPDDEAVWPADARQARKSTVDFLAGIMADYPCISSCCSGFTE